MQRVIDCSAIELKFIALLRPVQFLCLDFRNFLAFKSQRQKFIAVDFDWFIIDFERINFERFGRKNIDNAVAVRLNIFRAVGDDDSRAGRNIFVKCLVDFSVVLNNFNAVIAIVIDAKRLVRAIQFNIAVQTVNGDSADVHAVNFFGNSDNGNRHALRFAVSVINELVAKKSETARVNRVVIGGSPVRPTVNFIFIPTLN